MTTFAPMNATPARQPFGVLDGCKLRSLQSIKNRQNALTPHSAPSLKRRHASPELSDSENVDPNLLDLRHKRKRSAFDEDVSTTKPARYSLTTVPSCKPRPSLTPTTRLDTIHPAAATYSAPGGAAGRSPTKSKSHGVLGARKRFAPPQFGIRSPALSITAALNGTLANKKAKKMRTIQESKPKSWFFDIFEESDEQQEYTVNEWTMTQSAHILDISDDESKAAARQDRGKENIDPNEISMPMTRSMTAATRPTVRQNDKMTEELRTPLGDLDAADYYADGLDATSVVLVQDDVEEEATPNTASIDTMVAAAAAAAASRPQDFSFEAPAPVHREEKLSTADIGALLMASAPVWDTETLISSDDEQQQEEEEFKQEGTDVEIWESESAKDENEPVQPDSPGRDVGSIFAVQEI